jgi:hypothetical protein
VVVNVVKVGNRMIDDDKPLTVQDLVDFCRQSEIPLNALIEIEAEGQMTSAWRFTFDGERVVINEPEYDPTPWPEVSPETTRASVEYWSKRLGIDAVDR